MDVFYYLAAKNTFPSEKLTAPLLFNEFPEFYETKDKQSSLTECTQTNENWVFSFLYRATKSNSQLLALVSFVFRDKF